MEEKIRNILANLASVGEDLLALSDDIWLNIPHNDNDAVKRGTEFKISFNEKMHRYAEVAGELSRLIQSYTQVSGVPEIEDFDNPIERETRDRVIQELDRKIPHSLNEDFRYKRPYGCILEGNPYSNLISWHQIYEAVCRHLYQKNRHIFLDVRDNPTFISNRGNKYFSSGPNGLRDAREFVGGVFVEVNLSANQIRDNIQRLFDYFQVPYDQFTVYLREDRDAG